jgi:4-aminobutyrate aminotransferase/(S)-3-amino-2-methylpropionate transaminase
LEPPRPKSKELLEKYAKNTPLFSFLPVVFSEGEGAIIKDVDGNTYLDFNASDYNLGHCHPEVTRAIQEQASKLILHCMAGAMEAYINFTEKIKTIMPSELKEGKITSMSAGSEVNEIAMYSARAVTGRPLILGYIGGWHGELPYVMGVMGRHAKYRIPPDIYNIVHLPYPYCYRCPFGLEHPECALQCVEYIKMQLETIARPNQTAGLIFEPIQVPSGFIFPPKDYWPKIQKICKENGILMIADEVIAAQRTGKWWAIENWNVIPDMLTAAKSLAFGAPLSILVGKKEIMDKAREVARIGSLKSSMGGSPLACAAAIAGIEVIKKERLLEKAVKDGEYFMKGLAEIAEEHELIGDIRGKGLLVGVELVKNKKTKEPATKEAYNVCLESFKRGLVFATYGMYDNVLRFFPPLITTRTQFDKALNILDEAMKAVEKGS